VLNSQLTVERKSLGVPGEDASGFSRRQSQLAVLKAIFVHGIRAVFVRGFTACAAEFARGEVNYGGA